MRLELSLSSRSVTIGTAALAYLHGAACRAEGKKTVARVGVSATRIVGVAGRAAGRGEDKEVEEDRKRKAKCSWMHRYEWHASLAWVVAP